MAVRINHKKYYTEEDKKAVYRKVYTATGIVKLTMGICINMAWNHMRNALDSVKRHPKYRHKVKAAFQQADKAYKDYERTLKYGHDNVPRFFNIKDVKCNIFKENMTSEEYFELWQALGGAGYNKCINETNVLKHKFYLILDKRNDKYADIGSELLVTSSMFEITCNIYNATISEICKAILELDKDGIENYIFKPFDISDIIAAWERAVNTLYPDVRKTELDDFEDANLHLALAALEEKMTSPEWMERVEEQALRDYNDYMGGKKNTNKIIKAIRESFEGGGFVAV
jgi:hypothetical protein